MGHPIPTIIASATANSSRGFGRALRVHYTRARSREKAPHPRRTSYTMCEGRFQSMHTRGVWSRVGDNVRFLKRLSVEKTSDGSYGIFRRRDSTSGPSALGADATRRAGEALGARGGAPPRDPTAHHTSAMRQVCADHTSKRLERTSSRRRSPRAWHAQQAPRFNRHRWHGGAHSIVVHNPHVAAQVGTSNYWTPPPLHRRNRQCGSSQSRQAQVFAFPPKDQLSSAPQSVSHRPAPRTGART